MPAAPDRVLTRQGEDRRAELLAHAERLLLERGVAGTRMRDIAEAAGVAKGLVYWYFDSKDALLLAIVLDVRERLRAAQIHAIGDIAEPLDQLYVGTELSVRFIDEHWNLYTLLQSGFTDPAHADALGESAHVHALDTIAVVEAGQAVGTIRTEDPNVLAHANQGVVNHFVLSCRRGHLPDVGTAAHAAARTVVHIAAASAHGAAATIARRGPAATT